MVFFYFPSQASLNTSTKTRTLSPTVFINKKNCNGGNLTLISISDLGPCDEIFFMTNNSSIKYVLILIMSDKLQKK